MNGQPQTSTNRDFYGSVYVPYQFSSKSIQPYASAPTSSNVISYNGYIDFKNHLLSKFIRTITDKNFDGSLGNFIPELISSFVSTKINSKIMAELTVNISKTGNVFLKYGLVLGDKAVCENNLNNYLKDLGAFRVENSLIAQGYCGRMALLNAVPTYNNGQIILKSAMASHMSMAPESLFDLTPNRQLERSFLEKGGDMVSWGSSYIQKLIANVYSASQIPGEIVGDMLTYGYVKTTTIKDWFLPESEMNVIGDAFINNELSEILNDDNYNNMILNELTSNSDLEHKNIALENKEVIDENSNIEIEPQENVSITLDSDILVPVTAEIDIDIEINTMDQIKYYGSIVSSYCNIINQGISWIEFYRRLDSLSSKELAKHFLARFLIFVSYDPSISYGHILVAIANLIEKGSIRVEEALAICVELAVGIPCMGTFKLLGDLVSGRKIEQATVIQCAVEVACIVYPPLRIVVVIYQVGCALYYYYKDYDVDNDKKIYGLGVSIVTCRTWKGWLKWRREARLRMPLLDIDITTFSKTNEQSKNDALDIAKVQVKDRAYTYLGISYIFLDEDYKRSKTRLDNYRFARLFEILNGLWKEKANMTKEELAIYEAFTEDKETKDRRIDFQIRGKVDSFYNLHKNDSVVKFINDFVTILGQCKNSTEIAFVLFNLISETGREPGKKIQITGHLKSILIYLGVDVSALERQINFQKTLTKEQYEKEKDEINKKEYDAFNRLIHDIRNGRRNEPTRATTVEDKTKRTPLKNHDKELKEAETNEIAAYQKGKGNYTVQNIIIYANKKLFQIEISMGYAVGTVISGTNSVMITSVAYLDRELLIFSAGPIKYYPNKIKQICIISMQNYVTNMLASHISLSISLLPSMQCIDDDYFKYIVVPNCNIAITYMFSVTGSYITRSQDHMNKGQKIMANINNVLRTNISSINELIKNNKKIKASLTKSCTQLVKKPLAQITQSILQNTPQEVISLINYIKDSKAISVLSEGFVLINSYFSGLKVTIGAMFLDSAPLFIQNNIYGILGMIGYRILDTMVFWYKLPKINWEMVYEYERYQIENTKMITLTKLIDDDLTDDSSKELIIIDLIINGYANYPDTDNSIYINIEGHKNVNKDEYYGINNRNKNIIDTNLEYRDELYIDIP